jgi:hypothetical protein
MLDSDLDLDSDSAPLETELEKIRIRAWTLSAPISARPPRPRVHPRTTSRSPSSAQSMTSSNANTGGSRVNTLRLLGHGRVPSIDRAARSRCITAHQTSVIHDDNHDTDNSCICVRNYGIPRSAGRALRSERGAR